MATAPLREREATIWDVHSGKPLTLLTHPSNVSAVAYDPSGQFLTTGSVDGSVRIWDMSQEHAIVEYVSGGNRSVIGLRFTSDGSRLIVGWENNVSEIIPWRPLDSVATACSHLTGNVLAQQFREYVKEKFTPRACK